MDEKNPSYRKHGELSEGEDSDFDDEMYLKVALNQLEESDVEVVREIKEEEDEVEKKVAIQVSNLDDSKTNDTPSKRGAGKRYWIEEKCWTCHKPGHASAECPVPCFLCGQHGHSKTKCRTPICYRCGTPGHRSRECQLKRESRRRRSDGDSYSRDKFFLHDDRGSVNNRNSRHNGGGSTKGRDDRYNGRDDRYNGRDDRYDGGNGKYVEEAEHFNGQGNSWDDSNHDQRYDDDDGHARQQKWTHVPDQAHKRGNGGTKYDRNYYEEDDAYEEKKSRYRLRNNNNNNNSNKKHRSDKRSRSAMK